MNKSPIRARPEAAKKIVVQLNRQEGHGYRSNNFYWEPCVSGLMISVAFIYIHSNGNQRKGGSPEIGQSRRRKTRMTQPVPPRVRTSIDRSVRFFFSFVQDFGAQALSRCHSSDTSSGFLHRKLRIASGRTTQQTRSRSEVKFRRRKWFIGDRISTSDRQNNCCWIPWRSVETRMRRF